MNVSAPPGRGGRARVFASWTSLRLRASPLQRPKRLWCVLQRATHEAGGELLLFRERPSGSERCDPAIRLDLATLRAVRRGPRWLGSGHCVELRLGSARGTAAPGPKRVTLAASLLARMDQALLLDFERAELMAVWAVELGRVHASVKSSAAAAASAAAAPSADGGDADAADEGEALQLSPSPAPGSEERDWGAMDAAKLAKHRRTRRFVAAEILATEQAYVRRHASLARLRSPVACGLWLLRARASHSPLSSYAASARVYTRPCRYVSDLQTLVEVFAGTSKPVGFFLAVLYSDYSFL